jgi:hypothetical protein
LVEVLRFELIAASTRGVISGLTVLVMTKEEIAGVSGADRNAA